MRHRTNVLQKCGFEQKDSGRSPEEKWVFEVRGRMIAYTSLPRGRGDIPKGTFSKILKYQMFLKREEYEEIYSCKKRRDYYLEILEREGKLK